MTLAKIAFLCFLRSSLAVSVLALAALYPHQKKAVAVDSDRRWLFRFPEILRIYRSHSSGSRNLFLVTGHQFPLPGTWSDPQGSLYSTFTYPCYFDWFMYSFCCLYMSLFFCFAPAWRAAPVPNLRLLMHCTSIPESPCQALTQLNPYWPEPYFVMFFNNFESEAEFLTNSELLIIWSILEIFTILGQFSGNPLESIKICIVCMCFHNCPTIGGVIEFAGTGQCKISLRRLLYIYDCHEQSDISTACSTVKCTDRYGCIL